MLYLIKNPSKEFIVYTMRNLYPLPPFNFTYKMIDIMFKKEMELIEKSSNEEILSLLPVRGFAELLSNIVNEDINEYLRLIKVDDLLMNIVEHTDNEIFYRPLTVPTMFIDNELMYENYTIKGITIVDLDFYKTFKLEKTKTEIEFESKGKNYFIFVFLFNRKTFEISLEFFTLEYDIVDTNIQLKNYIRNVICNTLDMIYAMDDKLNVTLIETTKEQNIKRIKRDQIPLPTKIFIKPKDDFKQYVYKFIKDMEEGTRKIGHKFLVRGHWRHFRSERYKIETRANPVWIKPFWKGEGIPIAKEYMITK